MMRKNCHFLFTWLPYHVKKLNIEYPRRAKLWKGRSTFCFSSIFWRHAPPIKRYSPTNRLSSFWLLKLKLVHQIPNSVAKNIHVRITLVESDFFYHAAFPVLRPHKCWMTINQFLGIFQKTFWVSIFKFLSLSDNSISSPPLFGQRSNCNCSRSLSTLLLLASHLPTIHGRQCTFLSRVNFSNLLGNDFLFLKSFFHHSKLLANHLWFPSPMVTTS